MKKRFWVIFYLFGLLFFGQQSFAAETELPSRASLEAAISVAEANEGKSPDNALLLNNLRDTLSLLDQIEQQKNSIESLQKTVDNADGLMKQSQDNLNNLNSAESIESLSKKWDSIPLDQLTVLQGENEKHLQQIQAELSNLNGLLVAQRSVPERMQAALSENLVRSQELKKLLFSAQVSPSLANKFHAELQLIELKNQYNQLNLSGNSKLTSLYESQVAEKNLEQQQLQAVQSALQERIRLSGMSPQRLARTRR